MSYPGGKSGAGVYQTLINLMPPHEIYIEPFLGMGGVLRRKKPAPIANIGIDADEDVVEIWQREPSGFTVICADGIRFLEERKWTGRELVYCDPPYLMHTRRQQRRVYRHEIEAADHRRLLSILVELPCLVMISGYDSGLYRQMLRGWIRESFPSVTRGGSVATEWVWMNFAKPDVLHDYRYVGKNFRERQDLKRKAGRWRRRLLEMPMRDRLSVLSALVDLASPLVPMSAEHGKNAERRRQAAAVLPVKACNGKSADSAGGIGKAAVSGSRTDSRSREKQPGRNGSAADEVLPTPLGDSADGSRNRYRSAKSADAISDGSGSGDADPRGAAVLPSADPQKVKRR